jgi:hypothetical protein
MSPSAFLSVLVQALPWVIAGVVVGMAVAGAVNWRMRRYQRQLLVQDERLLANDEELTTLMTALVERLNSVALELQDLRAELRTHITSDLLHSPTDPPVNPEAVPPPHPTPRHARSPAAPNSQEQREGTP